MIYHIKCLFIVLHFIIMAEIFHILFPCDLFPTLIRFALPSEQPVKKVYKLLNALNFNTSNDIPHNTLVNRFSHNFILVFKLSISKALLLCFVFSFVQED